jgi:hypothetical protein
VPAKPSMLEPIASFFGNYPNNPMEKSLCMRNILPA